MKKTRKTSVSVTEDVLGIWDAICARKGASRSEVLEHLLIFAGLTGGDFPLTTKILGLPELDRDRIIEEIRRKSECGEPARPQAFKQWMKEAIGKDDPESIQRGVEALLRNLLAK